MPFPIGQASMKIYLPNKKLFFPQMTGQEFPKPCMLTVLTCTIMLKGVFYRLMFHEKKKKTCQWANASTANREFHHDFS